MRWCATRPVRAIGVLALLGSGALSLFQSIEAPVASNDLTLFWEAEAAQQVAAPFWSRNDPQASEGRYVEIFPGPGEGELRYEVQIEKAGKYHLWARTKWLHACRDMLQISINGTHHSILGNDSLYGTWHWVRGSTYTLHRGINTISVRDSPYADNSQSVKLDRFLFTNLREDDTYALVRGPLRKPAGPLVSDDFSGRWQEHWSPLGGHWERRAQASLMYLEQTTPERTFLLTRAPETAGYALEAALRTADHGMLGLVFAYRDDRHYSIACLTQKRGGPVLQLLRISDGFESILAEEPVPSRPGAWARLRVEVLGAAVEVFLNEMKSVSLSRGVVARGRAGLFSDDLAKAGFDDVKLLSIDAFSDSSFLGRQELPIAVIAHVFASPTELQLWQIERGRWSIQKGLLRSRAAGTPLILHRRILWGPFDLDIETRMAPGQALSLHLFTPDVEYTFTVECLVGVLRTSAAADGQVLRTSSLPSLPDATLSFHLARNRTGFSLQVNGVLALEIAAAPAPGAVQLGIEAAAGSASISSFRVHQTPHYSYNPWDAPVGWEPGRGSIEMGHAFLSAGKANEPSVLWNSNNFSCSHAFYESVLIIRGDAAPGAYVDLILCNQGTDSVNGTALRFELSDRPRLFRSNQHRRAHLSLRRNGRVLADRSGVLPTHVSGFVPAVIRIWSANGVTHVYAHNTEVLRAATPIEADAGRVGLRLAPQPSDSRGVLGMALFRVFQ